MISVALWVCALLVPPPATAAPMVTPLTALEAAATTVFVGTMVPGQLAVDVDTVLRGNAALGRRTLTPSPDGSSGATGRVVLFIDAADTLRWVGKLRAGATLETGVVELEGFHDWNAHRVEPGLMTYGQLLDVLAGEPLVQELAVTLEVPDTGGGYLTWGAPFAIHYAPSANTATMSGMSAACLTDVQVHASLHARLDILLTCATSARRLRLSGRATGVDAHGAISVAAVPARPYLDVHNVDAFMKDASIVDMERVLEVRLSDGGRILWHPDTDALTTSLSTYAGGFLIDALDSFALGRATLGFHPRERFFGDPTAALIEMIDRNAYSRCVVAEPDKPPRGCTLGRGRSKPIRSVPSR